MEKTFVDWYLLGFDSESKLYSDKVLAYVDGLCEYESLNAFEICLLIEMTLKKGTDKMKENATKLAKKLIDEQERKEKNKDPKERNKIFDIVLSLANLDKDQDLDLDAMMAEESAMVLMEEVKEEEEEEDMDMGGFGGDDYDDYEEEECDQVYQSRSLSRGMPPPPGGAAP